MKSCKRLNMRPRSRVAVCVCTEGYSHRIYWSVVTRLFAAVVLAVLFVSGWAAVV